MNAASHVQNDKERLLSLLSRLRGDTDDLEERLGAVHRRVPEAETDEAHERVFTDVASSLRSVRQRCGQLTDLINQMDVEGSDEQGERNTDAALTALTAVGVIRAELQAITYADRRERNRRGRGRSDLRLFSKQVRQQTVPLAHQVNAHLLSLLCQLAQARGWSVSGTVGSNLLYFQGDVDMTVHFGRAS